MRRIIMPVMLMMIATLVALGLSGCAGGGAPSAPTDDTAEDTAMVQAVIAGFEQGIEDYSISGMTDSLSLGFKLTLREGGSSYDKTLDELRAELEADESNQLYWRAQFGYGLDLRLTSLTVSTPSGGGATAAAQFEVEERADDTDPPIPPQITDSGTISWQLAKVAGNWKIAAMTISFDARVNAMQTTAGRSGAAVSAFAAPGGLPGTPFFRRNAP